MADAAIALFISKDTPINRINKILQENMDHLQGERYVWIADPNSPPGDVPGQYGTAPPIDPNWISPFLNKTPQQCGNWLDWLHQFCEHQFQESSVYDIVELGGCHVLDKSQFLFLDTHLRKFGRREERLPSALQTPRTPYATFGQHHMGDLEESYQALRALQDRTGNAPPLLSPPLPALPSLDQALKSPTYAQRNSFYGSDPLSPRDPRNPQFDRPQESLRVVDEGPNRMPIEQIPSPIDPIIAERNLFLNDRARPANLHRSMLRGKNTAVHPPLPSPASIPIPETPRFPPPHTTEQQLSQNDDPEAYYTTTGAQETNESAQSIVTRPQDMPTPPPPLSINTHSPSTVASAFSPDSADTPNITSRLERLELGPLRIDDDMRLENLREQTTSVQTAFEEDDDSSLADDERAWDKSAWSDSPRPDIDGPDIDGPDIDEPASATSVNTTKTWDLSMANWDEMLVDRRLTPEGLRPESTVAVVGMSPLKTKSPDLPLQAKRKATPPPWAKLHHGWYETL